MFSAVCRSDSQATRPMRTFSAASFFADSDSEESEEEPDATKDELKEYLALPQIKHKLKSLYKS